MSVGKAPHFRPPRLLSAPVVWRNFTVWKQKHMWSTVSQHVLEFYWRKQLFVWEVKINECVLNKTKDGDRFQMKEDDLFLSKDRMLMWWRNTSTQASTARTEQTRRPTETLYTRRARAFNMCSKLLKMFHRLLCSLMLCAGETSSGLVAPTEWVNWWGRLAPWLAANWTFLKLWKFLFFYI